MLVINKDEYVDRAEIIREKGTNRAAFFRGLVDKYGWVDIGSSFLPSDITAAILYAQISNINRIQGKRKLLWRKYFYELSDLVLQGYFQIPEIPEYATNNAHMFSIIVANTSERSALIEHLAKHEIQAVFHYQSLHRSSFFEGKHDGRELKYADIYSNQLLRLPMYYEMTEDMIEIVASTIKKFYLNQMNQKNIRE